MWTMNVGETREACFSHFSIIIIKVVSQMENEEKTWERVQLHQAGQICIRTASFICTLAIFASCCRFPKVSLRVRGNKAERGKERERTKLLKTDRLCHFEFWIQGVTGYSGFSSPPPRPALHKW